MHRPSRPKSAKGKSRITRTPGKYDVTQDSVPSVSSRAMSSNTSQPSQHPSITSAIAANLHKSASSSPNHASASTNGPTPAELFPAITRPTSSLSRYRILPSISATELSSGGDAWLSDMHSMDGRVSAMELLTEQAQQMILDSSVQKPITRPSPPSSANKRKVVRQTGTDERKRPRMYQTRSIFSSRTSISKEPSEPKVPREPGPEEERILLALKLPDGSRVERYFHPHARLLGVLAFAHSQYPILPISQCNLYRMDVVPKKLLGNTNLSLRDVNIQNRTVLYVEEKDDDD